MEIVLRNIGYIRPPWRLNSQSLSDENFVNFVSNRIDFFISMNKTPDIAAATPWETSKGYIRGEIISYSAHVNKLKKARLTVLTRCITQLDDIYAVSPCPETYKECLALQAEFDTLMTDQVTEQLLKLSSTFCEQGDKASKLLAHKLRQSSSSRQIIKIHTPSGISLDPTEINDEFKRFYQAPYTSENETGIPELNDFFDSLAVPMDSPELLEKLEQLEQKN